METIREMIRNVSDFPKPGIQFKDITTLLKDGSSFARVIDEFDEKFSHERIDVIVGIESRGFIFGSALAYKWGVGFVPVRKPGKLPAATIREEYELEYGTDVLEMHTDSIQKGQRVLIIDDLLATGGTMAATVKMVERLGGEIVALAFVIELSFLKGREKLRPYELFSLVQFSDE